MSIPILLICGCRKYKDSLMNALERFDNPVYKTIGIIGDLTQKTSFDGQILTLEVEDTYEYLPKKIYMALKWVLINHPDTQGVFKTDDDIYVKDNTHFTNMLVDNMNIPWWGFKMESLKNNAFPDSETIGKKKYTNKHITGHKEIKKGPFLWGAGYWISNTPLSLICKIINYPEIGREDLIIANTLIDLGYLPEEIKIGWGQIVRNVKCNQNSCLYKIHTNSNIALGSYCCSICMSTGGKTHDRKCQKSLHYFKNTKSLQSSNTLVLPPDTSEPHITSQAPQPNTISDAQILDSTNRQPILLICGCQKYKSTLISAIKRFKNPAYKTIGLLGDLDNPTSFNKGILTLQVEDTYEYLPKKINKALKWIFLNYPHTTGVFKTDDDIHIKDIQHFASILQTNSGKAWWGIKLRVSTETLGRGKIVKYTDNTVKIYKESLGPFLFGAGYWVSNSVLSRICNYEKYPERGFEDKILGSVLRDYGYKPEEISVDWKELPRDEKCLRSGCPYKINSNADIGKGAYCCNRCMKSQKNHGNRCERIIII